MARANRWRQSLLDTSRRDEITEAVELNLSRDEDSVTSLAAAPRTSDEDDSLVVLAGINSSVAEQKRNNNQHMRAFLFQAPRKAQGSTTNAQDSGEGAQVVGKEKEGEEKTQEDELIPGKAVPLSRASLFRTKDGKSADTYQRVLRLSRWKKAADPSVESQETRVGAITTGLASSGEVVLFSATESPSDSDVIGRIRLGNDEEAEDVDFASLENDPDRPKDSRGRFRLAYTNGVDVVVGEISSSTRSNAAPDVRTVYTIPLPSSGARAARPKFRALRFLTPTVLLLLQNAPERSGSELVLLRLPTAKHAQGQVLRRRKLPRSVKIGFGLDVCPLGTNPAGQEQTIIAASGSDNSISLWTLEYGPNKGYGPIRSYTTLRDVHPFSVTRLCFSTFTPPAHPITPEVGPQSVKLASVSMGNTVVVHTFPLLPFPASSRTARYVLTLPGPSEFWEGIYFLFALLTSFFLVILALLAFAEIRGATPPMLGAINLVPESWRDAIAVEYNPPPPPGQGTNTIFPPERYTSIPTTAPQVQTDSATQLESLKEILDRVHRAGAAPADLETASPQALSVIVRCNQDGARPDQSVIIETAASHKGDDAPPPSEEDGLCAWHELSSQDQALWKDRLTAAGRWTVDQGETILKGVFFSEACGRLENWVREEL